MIFKGSAVALVTPFDENGNINFFSLKNLIEYQIANGTKALVILGTTGESSTISFEEREKIIKFCVSQAGKRLPVIVGTGSNSTSQAINLTMQAEKLGADGALIVTPYYNKCNQIGLFEHYKKIAKSVHFPIILYNVPSRTGVNIEPETVLKLAKTKNIVGIKEASGNMKQIIDICHKKHKDFAVYSGDDSLTLPVMAVGCDGVISVTANAYPEQVSMLCDYMIKGDYINAQRINKHLFIINESLFLDVNPICVKFYLNLLGFNVGKTRLPLSYPTLQTQKILKEVKSYYEN